MVPSETSNGSTSITRQAPTPALLFLNPNARKVSKPYSKQMTSLSSPLRRWPQCVPNGHSHDIRTWAKKPKKIIQDQFDREAPDLLCITRRFCGGQDNNSIRETFFGQVCRTYKGFLPFDFLNCAETGNNPGMYWHVERLQHCASKKGYSRILLTANTVINKLDFIVG